MYRTWCEGKLPNILSACKKITQLSDTAASDVSRSAVCVFGATDILTGIMSESEDAFDVYFRRSLLVDKDNPNCQFFRMYFRFCILRGTIFFSFFVNG